MAELQAVALIKKILLFISPHVHSEGQFQTFKVETNIILSDPWRVCKGPYSVAPPLLPHELRCDQATTTRYIKLSIAGDQTYLRIQEVIVI